MGFLGLTMAGLGSSLGSGISSGITSAASGMMSGAINGIFGGIKAKKQHKRNKEILALQNEYEKERMELQSEMNKEQAQFNQGLALDMFDYTAKYNSPGEERKRLEEAGLNPALMYGGGGAGGSGSGSTAGAGAAQGVTALQPMGLQVALQAEMQKAQIDALNAQTMKTNAEAAAVGVEIKKTDTEINLNEITAAKTEKEIDNISADIANKTEQLRGQILQNDILDETKEFQINQAAESYRQMVMQTQKILAEAELSEKEKEMIQKELDGFERKLQALEKQADAAETSAEAAINSAKAAYKSAEALEKQVGIAEEKSSSEIAKNWSGTLDGVLKAGGIILDLILLKKLKAAGFTLKGAYKVIKAARGGS